MIRYKSNGSITYFASSTEADNAVSKPVITSKGYGKKRVCIKYHNSTTSYGLMTDPFKLASKYSPKININSENIYFAQYSQDPNISSTSISLTCSYIDFSETDILVTTYSTLKTFVENFVFSYSTSKTIGMNTATAFDFLTKNASRSYLSYYSYYLSRQDGCSIEISNGDISLYSITSNLFMVQYRISNTAKDLKLYNKYYNDSYYGILSKTYSNYLLNKSNFDKLGDYLISSKSNTSVYDQYDYVISNTSSSTTFTALNGFTLYSNSQFLTNCMKVDDIPFISISKNSQYSIKTSLTGYNSNSRYTCSMYINCSISYSYTYTDKIAISKIGNFSSTNLSFLPDNFIPVYSYLENTTATTTVLSNITNTQLHYDYSVETYYTSYKMITSRLFHDTYITAGWPYNSSYLNTGKDDIKTTSETKYSFSSYTTDYGFIGRLNFTTKNFMYASNYNTMVNNYENGNYGTLICNGKKMMNTTLSGSKINGYTSRTSTTGLLCLNSYTNFGLREFNKEIEFGKDLESDRLVILDGMFGMFATTKDYQYDYVYNNLNNEISSTFQGVHVESCMNSSTYVNITSQENYVGASSSRTTYHRYTTESGSTNYYLYATRFTRSLNNDSSISTFTYDLTTTTIVYDEKCYMMQVVSNIDSYNINV